MRRCTCEHAPRRVRVRGCDYYYYRVPWCAHTHRFVDLLQLGHRGHLAILVLNVHVADGKQEELPCRSTHTSTHAHTHTSTHTHTHTHTHMQAPTRMHPHSHEHPHTPMHMHMRNTMTTTGVS